MSYAEYGSDTADGPDLIDGQGAWMIRSPSQGTFGSGDIWARADLNRRPTGYEPVALSRAKLRAHRGSGGAAERISSSSAHAPGRLNR
jgi:hypothetical protein